MDLLTAVQLTSFASSPFLWLCVASTVLPNRDGVVCTEIIP